MDLDQRDVCRRFDTEFMPPERSDKVGIALATLASAPLNAVRLAPESGTCGWFIHGGDYSSAADFYQPLHVGHLEERCPGIVPYLALPPGYRVLLGPDYEDVWFDVESAKNSPDRK